MGKSDLLTAGPLKFGVGGSGVLKPAARKLVPAAPVRSGERFCMSMCETFISPHHGVATCVDRSASEEPPAAQKVRVVLHLNLQSR